MAPTYCIKKGQISSKDIREWQVHNIFSLHFFRVDLESEAFGSHLAPFLNEKTSHFMHELVSFAKSPYDIIAYDGKVKYNWPARHPEATRPPDTEEKGSLADDSSAGRLVRPQ